MQEDTTIYQSLSSREWDFNDWEVVTDAEIILGDCRQRWQESTQPTPTPPHLAF
jgi:hypothetical protein